MRCGRLAPLELGRGPTRPAALANPRRPRPPAGPPSLHRPPARPPGRAARPTPHPPPPRCARRGALTVGVALVAAVRVVLGRFVIARGRRQPQRLPQHRKPCGRQGRGAGVRAEHWAGGAAGAAPCLRARALAVAPQPLGGPLRVRERRDAGAERSSLHRAGRKQAAEEAPAPGPRAHAAPKAESARAPTPNPALSHPATPSNPPPLPLATPAGAHR